MPPPIAHVYIYTLLESFVETHTSIILPLLKCQNIRFNVATKLWGAMGSHGAVVILDHLMWTGLTDIHLGSMLSGYLNCLCNGTWVFSFGTMGWPKICWSLLCHWEFCSAHHWNHITRIIFRNACYLYQRDLKPLALVKCQNTGFNFTVKKSYCGATRTLSPMVIHDPYVWVRPGSIPGWCWGEVPVHLFFPSKKLLGC